MTFSDQRTFAWSSDKLQKLWDMRYVHRMTYDQITRKLYRTSYDIVNALSIMRQRKQGGQDVFEQIGSDIGLIEAEEWEKAMRSKYKGKKGETS